MRIPIICVYMAVAVLCGGGCSKTKREPVPARMGENLTVGALIYNVLDTEWKDKLPDEGTSHLPSNRFLLVRLSITNSGGSETIVPAMTLIDDAGTAHNEVTDVKGVGDWLGMVRRVEPAQTEQGVAVFDVPLSSYTLQVGYEDDDDPEKEEIGRVHIPLKLESDSAAPADTAPPRP